MNNRKIVVFLGDGMADEPLDELDGLTPLQRAHTPAMDAIAREGACGTFRTLPENYPTSSDVANMSVLGCDLTQEYCGRGPLEAAGRGIPLQNDDIVFRMNFTTDNNGILEDFSAGHLADEHATAMIAALNQQLATPEMRFFHGVSYRNLLVLSGGKYSARVITAKPDDHQGDKIADHLPQALDPAAEKTAQILSQLMLESREMLEAMEINRLLRGKGTRMANGLWPWSGGRPGQMRSFMDKYHLRGAVISAVDVIRGLGRCLGMTVLDVPGATGYIDTNYEGKADATLAALQNHDFVFVHVEAIDEVSHEGDLQKKLGAIEDFDRRLVSRVLAGMPPQTTVAVLPDHPVPVKLRKHTRTPVPVAIRGPGITPDNVARFDEQSCIAGRLGLLQGAAFMQTLCRCR